MHTHTRTPVWRIKVQQPSLEHPPRALYLSLAPATQQVLNKGLLRESPLQPCQCHTVTPIISAKYSASLQRGPQPPGPRKIPRAHGHITKARRVLCFLVRLQGTSLRTELAHRTVQSTRLQGGQARPTPGILLPAPELCCQAALRKGHLPGPPANKPWLPVPPSRPGPAKAIPPAGRRVLVTDCIWPGFILRFIGLACLSFAVFPLASKLRSNDFSRSLTNARRCFLLGCGDNVIFMCSVFIGKTSPATRWNILKERELFLPTRPPRRSPRHRACVSRGFPSARTPHTAWAPPGGMRGCPSTYRDRVAVLPHGLLVSSGMTLVAA